MERRRALGGFLPERRSKHTPGHPARTTTAYDVAKKGSGKQEIATTMAFVRLLKDLLRDKDFGHRIVPIIPDEARTFGMDAFFPTAKIYNPNGQNYTSVDRELLLAYKESPQGQIIHVGINEAGAVAAFTAAGTVVRHARRAAHPGLRLLLDVRLPAHRRRHVGGRRPDGARLHHRRHRRPHHADRRGPAARRRPLAPARLDQPGVSPTTRPTATRSAHIVRAGLERMYGGNHPDPNVMYYLTVYNEPIVQPAEPEDLDVDGILARHLPARAGRDRRARARSSSPPASACRGRSRPSSCSPTTGASSADVWSVTSWTELRRDGLAADEHNFLNPGRAAHASRTSPQKLAGADGSVRRGHRLHARRAGPDPPVRARRLRDARRRRLRLLATPAPPPAASSRSTARRSWCARCRRSPPTARSTAALAAQAIEKYRLHDVNAGTTGNAGGES